MLELEVEAEGRWVLEDGGGGGAVKKKQNLQRGVRNKKHVSRSEQKVSFRINVSGSPILKANKGAVLLNNLDSL